MSDEIQTNGAPQSQGPPAGDQQVQSSPAAPPPDSTPQTGEGQKTYTVADALSAFDNFAKSDGRVDPGPGIQTQPPGPDRRRDYSGLDEGEVKLFKAMSNDAYARLYPHYLESKKWKSQLDELQSSQKAQEQSNFYTRDGAWTLSPEHRYLSGSVNQLSSEANYWQQQLALVRAGHNWKDLSVDDKGNVFVVQQEKESDPESEAYLIGRLQESMSKLTLYQDKLNQFETSYKTQHGDFINHLNGIKAKILPNVDSAKLNAAAAEKLKLFPSYLQSDPLVKGWSETLVILDGLLHLLNQQKDASVVNGMQRRTQMAAGPGTSDVTQSSGGNRTTVGNVMDEFKRARSEGIA